jgi:hypothetical protein
MGTEVLQFFCNGKFPKKRNWALQNRNLLHEWVLFLDADEFVTTAFVNQLEIKTKTPIIIVPRYSLRTILWVKNYDMAIGCLVIATN